MRSGEGGVQPDALAVLAGSKDRCVWEFDEEVRGWCGIIVSQGARMTNEQFESELGKCPFVPFRIHLVSGKTVDVMTARSADMMNGAVMVFHPIRHPSRDAGY